MQDSKDEANRGERHDALRILLIASYFPPDIHVGAQRWTRLSHALSQRGHHVLIVAPKTRGGACTPGTCEQDTSYSFDTEVLRIPLPMTTRWAYCVWAVIRKAALIAAKTLGAKNSLSQIDSFFIGLRRKLFFPHFSWRWGARVARTLAARCREEPFDVVVATHPYLGNLRAASQLSSRCGIPWVADIRDPIHNDHQLEDRSVSQRLLPIERELLDSACAVMTINHPLAEMLATEQQVEVISQSFSSVTAESGILHSDVGFKMVYTGSIQSSCRYKDFFAPLAQIDDVEPEQRVAFDYYGKNAGILRDYRHDLDRLGIELNDHGVVGQRECRSAQRSADVLVVFGWDGEGHRCVMTGKIFDYLAAGKPVIAVAHKDSALSQLIEETGVGWVLDRQGDIVDFWERLLSDPSQMRNALIAQCERSDPSKYTTEQVATKLESLLVNVVRQASASESPRVRSRI